MDLRFTKYLSRGPLKYRFYLEVENLFNDRRVRRIDRETGEAPQLGRGSYSEDTGSLYTIYQLGDPSYYGQPRQATIGMGIEW
jgi:hypothetical protein